MERGDEFEIDPAVAAAMGFSGFGTQPSKKRKFNKNDGFVDPDASQAGASQGTSANQLPLGEPKAARTSQTLQSTTQDSAIMQKQAIGSSSEPPSLDALRLGVRNGRGDMVYFLPSFIEDPWAGLKPQ